MSDETFIDCIYSDSFCPDDTLTDRKDYFRLAQKMSPHSTEIAFGHVQSGARTRSLRPIAMDGECARHCKKCTRCASD